jgi:hypothetical protein
VLFKSPGVRLSVNAGSAKSHGESQIGRTMSNCLDGMSPTTSTSSAFLRLYFWQASTADFISANQSAKLKSETHEPDFKYARLLLCLITRLMWLHTLVHLLGKQAYYQQSGGRQRQKSPLNDPNSRTLGKSPIARTASPAYNYLASKGSRNSHVGVPVGAPHRCQATIFSGILVVDDDVGLRVRCGAVLVRSCYQAVFVAVPFNGRLGH